VLSFVRPPTKREFLRITLSFFDAVGLVSHALCRPKVFLGARLADTVAKGHQRLKLSNRFFWSDSNTTLSWIKSADPQRLTQFVGVRVGEIHDLTKTDEWKKVPTKLNVADDATKWNPDASYADTRWFVGPEFLYKSKDEWPACNNQHFETQEEHKKPIFLAAQPGVSFLSLPDEKYSTFVLTRRIVAYMLKFVNNCKVKIGKNRRLQAMQMVRLKNHNLPVLSVLEIERAENALIRIRNSINSS
jgi:hypothetical protein